MSLYPTREEALAAPGLVYQHWKGGVYRVLGYTPAGAVLPDVLPLNDTWGGGRPPPVDLVVYEHLWPYTHQYYVRPSTEFFDHNARPTHVDRYSQVVLAVGQMGRRFTPITGDAARLVGQHDQFYVKTALEGKP